MSKIRKMSTNCPIKLIPEQYESSAEAQSQNQNLVPRKCWLHISQLSVKPNLFERNQKLRMIIHIPNSNREVKTRKIPIDESAIKYLNATVNSAGFSTIPIDVTIIYEYKHDIQLDHPSFMAIEIEIISSILGRSKSVGQINVNMSDIIQKNVKNTFQIAKEGMTVAILQAEIHSLCLSKTTPITVTRSFSTLSDSDSEITQESTIITDQMMQQMLKDRRVLFLDESTHQGQVLRQALSVKDFVIPVKNNIGVQGFLNVAAQNSPYSLPIVIVLAGDDYFVAMVLKEMVSYREKGLISLESFELFVLPLSEKHNRMAQYLGEKCQHYSNIFLSPQWLGIFPEDSAVQNVAPQITSTVDSIFSSELKQIEMTTADVLITTATDQFVLTMFVSLSIGQSHPSQQQTKPTDNIKQMKCSMLQSKQKNILIKFYYFNAVLEGQGLRIDWRNVSNANIIPMIQSRDKYTYEQTSEKCTKFSMSLAKGQPPVDIFIDGIPVKGVMALNVTLRDPESSVVLSALA